MFRRTLLACLIVTLLQALAAAASPPNPKDSHIRSSSSSAGSGAALAGPLRELLVRNLPTPLYEASWDWGRTARVTTGIKWTGTGFNAHPHAVKEDKNDGTWRKVRIAAENVPGDLVLELRNIQHPEPGRTTFEVFLALDGRIEYEQQQWKAGIRLYSGRVRARLRIQLVLTCELISRLEWQGQFSPDAIFRLHVERAHLTYRDLIVEHIAGVGGDAARLLGEAVQRGIHHWYPSLERNLLAKANAAIEKAADTKEIRIGLRSLLNRKESSPAQTSGR
jgi:hypothetical protein